MRAASLLALGLCGGLLAACGGDESSDKAPAGSPENPLVALPNPTKGRTPANQPPEPNTSSRGSEGGRPAKARTPGSGQPETGPGNEATPTSTKKKLPAQARTNTRQPCTLVTKSQAQAIVGAPLLAPVQAPQGPTCIYRSRSGDSYVTLAVQSLSFAKIKPLLRQRTHVAVSDRTAYCGNYGKPMLYVRLSPGRLLSIAAPCRVAKQFASQAIENLNA